MALKPFNSVGGFSVGDSTLTTIILANGDVVTTNLTATGLSDLGNVGNITITGGSAGQFLQTDGNGALTFATVDAATLSNGNSNIRILNNANIVFSSAGNANVVTITGVGANINGTLDVTGNISASGVLTDNLYYANGTPWDLQQPAGSNTQIQYNDNGSFGASGNFTYDDSSQYFYVNGYANITGNVTVNNDLLLESGNIAGLNGQRVQIYSTDYVQLNYNNQTYVYTQNDGVWLDTNNGHTLHLDTNGNVTISDNLQVQGNIANANNITATNDITAGGNANITGNVTANNFTTTGASGNISGANVIFANSFTSNGGTVDFNTNGANVQLGSNANVHLYGGSSGQVLQTDGNGNLNWYSISASGIVNGTSNVDIPVADGNVNTSVGGNANVFVVTGTGANVNGTFNATGNLIAGNANLGNLAEANYVNVSQTLNGNVANFTGNLSASNANLGNLAEANYVNVSQTLNGNVANFSGNLTAQNANLGNLATANYVNVAQTLNGNVANFSGNLTSQNANLGNLAQANHAYILHDLTIDGNIYGNAIYSQEGSTLTIGSSYGNVGNYNINLVPAGTGNVDVNSTYITSLANPENPQDAATKYYVDLVAQGLDIKASVEYATAAALPAYTYDNGVDGVGATITANANGALSIDSGSPAAGQRVLIKNETGANEPYNGIYVVTDAGSAGSPFILTRATDFDNGSPSGEIPGGFTFVEQGYVNADTGWVCTTNAPVTMGTTNITFTQFSGAGSYTGANGISIVGTVISANVDNDTTAIVGGNIVVKTGANLVSPNIGAATGTSLELTTYANIGSDLNVSGNANVTGNITAGNITTAGSGGNIYGANVVSANTFNGNIVGNTANFSGNIDVGGILTDNYYYANGSPVDFQQAAGSNTYIQYNENGDFGASANFTYDDSTQVFTVNGTANVATANVSGNVNVGNSSINTAITWGSATTTSITANQTIASFSVTGVSGFEFLVKGIDSAGSKYSVATVVAVTDGTNVDYTTFTTVNLGGYTGSLAVNVSSGSVRLQVTPASSNSTVWTTQYRVI